MQTIVTIDLKHWRRTTVNWLMPQYSSICAAIPGLTPSSRLKRFPGMAAKHSPPLPTCLVPDCDWKGTGRCWMICSPASVADRAYPHSLAGRFLRTRRVESSSCRKGSVQIRLHTAREKGHLADRHGVHRIRRGRSNTDQIFIAQSGNRISGSDTVLQGHLPRHS